MRRLALVSAFGLMLVALSPHGAGLILPVMSPAVRAQVESELDRELAPLVRVFDVVAFTLDRTGRVTLLGWVLNPAIKEQAEEIARDVAGVVHVRNGIEVLPQSPADNALRLTIYYAIYGQETMARYAVRSTFPVRIIVRNGSVMLEGVVTNRFELMQANAAAIGVAGVLAVESNLTIGGNYEIRDIAF